MLMMNDDDGIDPSSWKLLAHVLHPTPYIPNRAPRAEQEEAEFREHGQPALDQHCMTNLRKSDDNHVSNNFR